LAAGVNSANSCCAFGAAIDSGCSGWTCLLEVGTAGQHCAAGGGVASFLGADSITVAQKVTNWALEGTGLASEGSTACLRVTQLSSAAAARLVELHLFACTTELAVRHIVAACGLFLAVAHAAVGRRPQDQAGWVIRMIRYAPLQRFAIAVFVQGSEALRSIQRCASTFGLIRIDIGIGVLGVVDTEALDACNLAGVACCLGDDAVLLYTAALVVALTSVAHGLVWFLSSPRSTTSLWEISSTCGSSTACVSIASTGCTHGANRSCFQAKRKPVCGAREGVSAQPADAANISRAFSTGADGVRVGTKLASTAFSFPVQVAGLDLAACVLITSRCVAEDVALLGLPIFTAWLSAGEGRACLALAANVPGASTGWAFHLGEEIFACTTLVREICTTQLLFAACCLIAASAWALGVMGSRIDHPSVVADALQISAGAGLGLAAISPGARGRSGLAVQVTDGGAWLWFFPGKAGDGEIGIAPEWCAASLCIASGGFATWWALLAEHLGSDMSDICNSFAF